jgi:plasmid replication initiation protein
VTSKDPGQALPTSVQKSYFLLGAKERDVLNLALSKYRPGQSELILIGGAKLLKPTLKLTSFYRLRIDEIEEDEVVTSYTRWLEAVIVKGTENQQVYVTFSPQFERIWLESKKRLPEYASRKPANLGLRSQYSIRFYDWAKKNVEAKTKTVSLEELRRVLGLESVKDACGNVIHEAPMPVWANFRQRALDVAIREINAKTDLKIKLASIERSKHRRVVALQFVIENQPAPKARTDR